MVLLANRPTWKGDPSHKRLWNLPKLESASESVRNFRNSFTVEALATSSHTWSFQTTYDGANKGLLMQETGLLGPALYTIRVANADYLLGQKAVG